mgnify:CR=1 FL=1
MKRITLLIASLLIIFVLGACSDKSDGKTKISYAYWDDKQTGFLEKTIEAFNEEHPDIEIVLEITPYAEYFTKLDAAATGGGLPDVFWMNGPNLIKYASNGKLEPLTDFIKEDGLDLSPYPKALVDLYNYDGDQFALPKDFDTNALWYNKEMFDEAGVAYPDETWEWDDLVEAAKKITDPEKDVYGIVSYIQSGQASYWNLIFSNDGYVISEDKKKSGFDDPNTIEALQLYHDLIHVHGVSPTHAQVENSSAVELFQSGKVAMLIMASYYTPMFKEHDYLKDVADVAPLPKMKKRSNVIHGLGNAISADTKEKEAAWEFVKFLASKEAQLIQAEGGLISTYEGTQDAWLKSAPQFNLEVFLEAAEYAEPYPISKDVGAWHSIMQQEIAKAWDGQITVEEAAKKIAEEMNAILADE